MTSLPYLYIHIYLSVSTSLGIPLPLFSYTCSSALDTCQWVTRWVKQSFKLACFKACELVSLSSVLTYCVSSVWFPVDPLPSAGLSGNLSPPGHPPFDPSQCYTVQAMLHRTSNVILANATAYCSNSIYHFVASHTPSHIHLHICPRTTSQAYFSCP